MKYLCLLARPRRNVVAGRMSSKGKGRGKSLKTKKVLTTSKGETDGNSEEEKPQGSLKMTQSPSRKDKKISSYFPVSPESTSSSGVAKQTKSAIYVVHEGHTDTLSTAEASSQNERDRQDIGTEKQPLESLAAPVEKEMAVLQKEKHHQEKTEMGSKAAVGKSSKNGKKGSKKKQETSKQTEITKHFPVRRSTRRCKSVVEAEKRKRMEEAILAGREEGVEVRDVKDKGRGVFASRPFQSEEFVCEYAGELIDVKTAQEREEFYQGKPEYGCYMYYFTFKNKKYCVDATKETGRLGRLLNHSKCGNCATRLVSVRDRPYLILETKRDIKAGEELLYDYGERNRDIIASHPWLET